MFQYELIFEEKYKYILITKENRMSNTSTFTYYKLIRKSKNSPRKGELQEEKEA